MTLSAMIKQAVGPDRLAFHQPTDLLEMLRAQKDYWSRLHGKRASFNWNQILSVISDSLPESGEVSTQDIYDLYARLDHDYRSGRYVDVSLADASQIIFDLTIKMCFSPQAIPQPTYEAA